MKTTRGRSVIRDTVYPLSSDVYYPVEVNLYLWAASAPGSGAGYLAEEFEHGRAGAGQRGVEANFEVRS